MFPCEHLKGYEKYFLYWPCVFSWGVSLFDLLSTTGDKTRIIVGKLQKEILTWNQGIFSTREKSLKVIMEPCLTQEEVAGAYQEVQAQH